jgi:hypothetical protein
MHIFSISPASLVHASLAPLALAAGIGAPGLVPAADAAPPAHMGAPAVKAGSNAAVNVDGAATFCRLVVDGKATIRRVPAATFQARWKVPVAARSGTHAVAIGCGPTRNEARRSTTAKLKLHVRHGRGHGRAVTAASKIRLRAGELLQLGHKLPPGTGDPDAAHAQLPAGTGGGPFATYLPFAQGLQVPITQGPGGTASHYTQYTQYAVDFGVPSGTEIHAGFTGVIARVNTGCSVGNHSCGDGYGITSTRSPATTAAPSTPT